MLKCQEIKREAVINSDSILSCLTALFYLFIM